jgi:hypothetical protein
MPQTPQARAVQLRQRSIELQGAGVVEHVWLQAGRGDAALGVEVADAEEAWRVLRTLPVGQNGAAELAAVVELVPARGPGRSASCACSPLVLTAGAA